MKKVVSNVFLLFVLSLTALYSQAQVVELPANPTFWQVHGIFFLIFMGLFPRLTMLFATAAPFGCIAWLGWIFLPRILAAILATHYYWDTNPVLCVVTWFFAIVLTGGTSTGTVQVTTRNLN